LLSPVLHLLIVLGGKLHDERVRHHGAAAGECGSAFVHVPSDGTGDLHGFQLGAERFGERAVDHPFDPLLEAVEDSHSAPPLLLLIGPVGNTLVALGGAVADMSCRNRMPNGPVVSAGVPHRRVLKPSPGLRSGPGTWDPSGVWLVLPGGAGLLV